MCESKKHIPCIQWDPPPAGKVQLGWVGKLRGIGEKVSGLAWWEHRGEETGAGEGF